MYHQTNWGINIFLLITRKKNRFYPVFISLHSRWHFDVTRQLYGWKCIRLLTGQLTQLAKSLCTETINTSRATIIPANNLSFTVHKKTQGLKRTDASFDLFSLIRWFSLQKWSLMKVKKIIKRVVTDKRGNYTDPQSRAKVNRKATIGAKSDVPVNKIFADLLSILFDICRRPDARLGSVSQV